MKRLGSIISKGGKELDVSPAHVWRGLGTANANSMEFCFTKSVSGLDIGFIWARKSNLYLILKNKHSRINHTFLIHRSTYCFDAMRAIESRKVLKSNSTHLENWFHYLIVI